MKTAIIGSVGIPASYGGFETLVENLVQQARRQNFKSELHVYCSRRAFESHPSQYLDAKLHYINLNANGVSSIGYDIISMMHAAIALKADRILILGVSGAIFIPFIRLFSSAHVITNIDGIEWKRNKWGRKASLFLRFSEYMAVRFSHKVISDNQGIADHVMSLYGSQSHIISYGGDHAQVSAYSDQSIRHQSDYAIAVCRIEPENNVHLILDAFSRLPNFDILFIGNWNNSDFGTNLRDTYSQFKNIMMIDPIYDPERLGKLRSNASLYIHGHSAGGTNPSLVEAMSLGLPVISFDCNFNRFTTHNKARFFQDAKSLEDIVSNISKPELHTVGLTMKDIASRQYTWEVIAAKYFKILGDS